MNSLSGMYLRRAMDAEAAYSRHCKVFAAQTDAYIEKYGKDIGETRAAADKRRQKAAADAAWARAEAEMYAALARAVAVVESGGAS